MENTKKLIVGIFVAGCLVLFGVGLFLIGNSSQLFTRSFHVYTDFAKVTGLQNGGRVRVAGMDAGTVTRIDVPLQPGGKFRVRLRIIEKLHPLVRRDSVVSIQTDGLLGNKFLQVEAGSKEEQLAANESRIPSKEPFDWGDLMDEINGAVLQVNRILSGIEVQIAGTLLQIEDTVHSANQIVKGAAPEVDAILVSARKISADLGEIIEGVQSGEGTVGALLKDKELYGSVKRSAENSERVVENLRETTTSARKIVDNVQASEIVPEVQRTVKSLQQITLQVKDAIEKVHAGAGGGGLGSTLQRTLTDAQEAMSDLSENTEALKRNFFFRGFFKKRGFYDLGTLTAQEYQLPAFGKGFKKRRIWLESASLFTRDEKGVEILSDEGQSKLDEAMTELLKLPRNGPLILEGFGGEGSASEQYFSGRRRATRAQIYLIDRFQLRPATVGIVSLGAEAGRDGAPGASKNGVGLVTYYK
jgi:phospholipid/cholesterol/gamma-HCH transport system substrate-binding protein